MLRLSLRIAPGQRAFQMATQLAFLECDEIIDRLAGEAAFRSAAAERLVRVGLANYFAGALLMPYGTFLAAAEAVGYDIELLGRRFGVGFETTCHRLSTLQRPEARGVPFFFIRTDRAGNISKRQSATDFHFSRIGGTCPLWTIYEAFARPGQILTQIAQMPDGAAISGSPAPSPAAPAATARRQRPSPSPWAATCAMPTGWSIPRGLDLRNPAAATQIGAGCKIRDRPACPQRAFPPAGRPLAANPGVSRFAPYSGG